LKSLLRHEALAAVRSRGADREETRRSLGVDRPNFGAVALSARIDCAARVELRVVEEAGTAR